MHKHLIIGGTPIRTNDDGLVSLTDIYAAAEREGIADGKQSPYEWSRRDGTNFIAFVADTLNTAQRRIYQSKRGKGGGTFAHWQIALAYAKYLSPQLHMQVNEVYARFKAGDVTLAEEIADRASLEDQERHAKRMAGKVARNQLTSTLACHGVSGKGFADCTNAIYKPILGGKKSEICAARNLPAKTNIRDVMDLEQLTRTSLAEIIARKRIERFNVRGNAPCATECHRAALSVAQVQ